MIINILKYKNRVWWILFHILLGIVATFNSAYVIGWFYFILAGTMYLISFQNINRPLLLAATMVYIGAFEVLARMTKCSPIIPWEASKYVFAILTLAGIYFSVNISKYKVQGILILLLILPALFIDQSGMVIFNDLVFNVMGIVNIGLGIIFFSALNVKASRFYDLIRLMIYPCITILIFTIIKTPELDEITFSLSAQTSTSGEFGSNQVSTVLGLGFLLMAIAWILNWKLTSHRMLDGLLASAFLIQGLFTFSRGGMIASGLALLIFLYLILFKTENKITIHASVKTYAIPVIAIIIGAIFYTNNLTGGKLFLRYQGETQGTMLGTRDKNIESITSGRYEIFLSDLELWRQYPIFGSGAGSSKYMRIEEEGLVAHLEFSRLLAEHGILGLLVFGLIIMIGSRFQTEKDLLIKSLKFALFALAIATTFHSATRTFISPLLISLCTINVITLKKVNDPIPGK